jgi:hypothetical protein
MDKKGQIETILKENNKIIKTKFNDPSNYFKIKLNQFNLNKVINSTLPYYISGPSIPTT